MVDRFERLFQLPQNLYSAGSPVIIVAGALLKDSQSQKILVQLKFKNISSHKVKALKVHITAYDASGERINGTKEYQYLDLSVNSGGVFGSNKAIILPNAESTSFKIESLCVVQDNNLVCSVAMPLVALPDTESLEKVLKHPELFKQFRLEINDKALFAPHEIQDAWQCSCGEWNGTKRCNECGVDKERLFSIYDPVTLVENTKVRLRKERAEREAHEEQARKNAAEEVKRLAEKDIIQKNATEYAYCEQCGSQIKIGVNFCRYCGTKITGYHVLETVTKEQQTMQLGKKRATLKQRKKTRVKRFVRAITIVSILLALAYGVFICTVKILEDNNTSKYETVKPQTTKSDQFKIANPKNSTTSKPKESAPTEPGEIIEHMMSFMKGYNYMTYDFNKAAGTNYPLITLDDIRAGHFKTSDWGSFDVYMSEQNDIEKVVYCAMMDDLLDNEDNFYEMVCNIAAIMHGMDNKLTDDQRKAYTGGILSYDFTDSSVYSKTYNGVTYEMDIAYGMGFRLVATRKS